MDKEYYFWISLLISAVAGTVKYLAPGKNDDSKERLKQLEDSPYHFDIGAVEFSTQDIDKLSQNIVQVVTQISQTLNTTAVKAKKEYYSILRQNNPTFQDTTLYDFDSILEEATLNFPLKDYQDYQQLLGQKFDKTFFTKNNTIQEGQILAFKIGITIRDGVMMSESQGFIDDYDIPPYDTWVYLKSIRTKNDIETGLLLCWIPKSYTFLIEQAMRYDRCKTYSWLADMFPELNTTILKKLAPYKII